jgi:hypothetical protein
MPDEDKTRARPTNLGDVGRRVDEEIEEFIRWFNNEAAPQLRRRSSRALRKAADKLAALANYMDQEKPGP